MTKLQASMARQRATLALVTARMKRAWDELESPQTPRSRACEGLQAEARRAFKNVVRTVRAFR